LVAKRDPAAIAEKLVRLLGDEELRRRMGVAGRKMAAEKFDLERNVGELLGVYGV